MGPHVTLYTPPPLPLSRHRQGQLEARGGRRRRVAAAEGTRRPKVAAGGLRVDGCRCVRVGGGDRRHVRRRPETCAVRKKVGMRASKNRNEGVCCVVSGNSG